MNISSYLGRYEPKLNSPQSLNMDLESTENGDRREENVWKAKKGMGRGTCMTYLKKMIIYIFSIEGKTKNY
jgi:hypothetical protein